MEVAVEGKQLARCCADSSYMVRKLGSVRGAVLQRRLKQLSAATYLEDLRNAPGHCHELAADRVGELSLDLDGPYRLIFRPTDDPSPAREDGGLDWGAVTSVTILEIADTH